ncbi:hypothetical protein AAG906_028054 [Vitis piasezkii]
MAAANALITMEEVPMLPSLGINPQFITLTHVTMESIGGCFFFYMRISNAYIVTVVSSHANITCTFKFDVEAVTLQNLILVGFLMKMLGSLWQCLRSWFLGF